MSRLTAPRDSNRISGLIVNDNATNNEIIVGGNPTLQSINVSVVEGSISLSGADGAITDGVSALIKATVFDLTNSNPLATQIVDATGTAITSFGGGTQYAELTTTDPATGTVALHRYNSTMPTLTNGQMAQPQLTTRGALKVSLFANDSATTIASIADNGDTVAESATANKIAVVGRMTMFNGTNWDRVRGDTTNGLDVDVTRMAALVTGSAIIGRVGIDQTTPGTTNLVALTAETTKVIGTVNIAAAQTLATVTTVGAVTAITNALPAGTNAIGKLAANSGVDIGDVDVTTIIPGTGATNLGKAIDSVAGVTDTGVAALAIRDDALTTLTPVDGDWAPLRVNSTGALHVTGGGGGTQYNVDDAAGATNTGTLALVVRDDALTTLTPVDGDYTQLRTDSTGALWVSLGTKLDSTNDSVAAVGNVAHDAADSGNPVKTGARAIAAMSGATLVAAADRADNMADLDGAQIVRENGAIGDYVNGNASNTDGTSTQVLAAGAAGIRHYITDVTITNMSATNIYVELKDGSTVKWTFPVPATSGVTMSFTTPIGGTAATAWNFDPSTAATTVYCSVAGFKSKI